MAGVPQKTVAQKKIEGTYRKDRDGEREKAEAAFSQAGAALPPGAKVSVPRSLRTRAGRSFFKRHVETLIGLQVLAAPDLPQVERLWVVYEKLAEIQARMIECDPLDGDFPALQKSFLSLARYFDGLAKSYFISPAARSRLALDALAVSKAAQEVRAGEDVIGALLSARR